MKISSLLTKDMVVPDLAGRSVGDALNEMVLFLKKRKKITQEKELLEKLIQREELGSTAIRNGFAIPHCKMKGLETPIILLGISKKGVKFHSIDGKPSQVFFLVVSSPENPSLNLQILATIAHLIRKSTGLKNKILDAEDVEGILSVITKEEDRIHE